MTLLLLSEWLLFLLVSLFSKILRVFIIFISMTVLNHIFKRALAFDNLRRNMNLFRAELSVVVL